MSPPAVIVSGSLLQAPESAREAMGLADDVGGCPGRNERREEGRLPSEPPLGALDRVPVVGYFTRQSRRAAFPSGVRSTAR